MRSVDNTTMASKLMLMPVVLCALINYVDDLPWPCPPGFLVYRDTGFCCEITTCGKFQQVVPCNKNGGKDSCEACPPHTYMFDSTTSQRPFQCAPYNCDPIKTKEVNFSSTTIDPYACRKYCQCDMSKNYCGTDPCKCERMRYCGYGKKQNQQCWCVMITKSSSMTTEVPVVKENHFTVPSDVNTETDNTTNLPPTTVTEKLKSIPPSTSREMDNAADSNDYNLEVIIGVSVAIAVFLLFLAYILKRSGGRCCNITDNNIICGGKGNYTNVDSNIHLAQKAPSDYDNDQDES